MPKKHELKDVLLEEMGIRVSEMDHLVTPVLDDLDASMKSIERTNPAYSGPEAKRALMIQALDMMSKKYYAESRSGRLFILDTYHSYLERQWEEEDNVEEA